MRSMLLAALLLMPLAGCAFVVLRLLQSGRLDPGFGRNGRVVIRNF